MSKSSISEPTRQFKWIAAILVAFYSLVTIMPLLWIVATGFKSSCRLNRISSQNNISTIT